MSILNKKWGLPKKKISFLLLVTVISSLFSGIGNFISTPTAYAAALPTCSYSSPNDPLIGENYNYTVTIDNDGADAGFKPIIETLLPTELTYTSASFSVGGGSLTPTTTIIVTDDDLGDPTTGDIINPINQEVWDDVPVGMTYMLFELPVGSFAPDQDAVGVQISATVDAGLDHDVALDNPIKSACSFAFGDADALNNPATDAPPTSGLVDLAVTPQVILLSKAASSTNGDNNEVSTGENFPYNYDLSANIATGEVLTPVTITDTFADEVQLNQIVSSTGGTCAIDIFYSGSVVADETTTCAALPFTPTMPGPGGKINVVYTSVTGGGGSNDASIDIEVFIPEQDAGATDILSATTGGAVTIQNTTSATATHFGHGAVAANIAAPIDVEANSLVVQKSVSLFTDIGAVGEYNPGDIIQYTMNFQVSDYFSFDELVLYDLLPDGLTYIASSSSLSVSENGATEAGITFAEASVAEANIISGPAFDFAGNIDCAGCELAITSDVTDDNDIVDPPSDGQTLLLFDLSSAMNGVGALDNELIGDVGGNATTGTLTFRATVTDDFIDADSVINDVSIDTLETITNNTTIYGRITSDPTNNYKNESSSASITIVGPSVAKTIAAIDVGSGLTTVLPDPVAIGAGDNVVYKITYTLPSGDSDDLRITDFLPIPFFDADELSGGGCGFQSSTLTTAYNGTTTFPGACQIGYGTNTDVPGGFPLNTGSAPDFLPAFTIDSANNSFTIDYIDDTTFDDPASGSATIEIYFNVTAQDEPFGSGLVLANFLSATVDNSTTSQAETGLSIVNVETVAPDISLTKGTVSASEGGTLKGVFLDATVGPSQLTYNLPGATPSLTFTGTEFSSTELAAEPAVSDVSGLDASDLVTFMIVIENSGTDSAYDLIFRDDFPTNLRPPAGGINLQLYEADGTVLADPADYTLSSGGIFGSTHFEATMDAAYDLNPLDTATQEGGISEGKNILIATYDLEVQTTAKVNEVITNDAALTQFGGTSGGNNFVTGQAALYEDSADVTIQTMRIDKDDNATDQASTSGTDVTIGEVVTYEIGIEFPEGTTSGISLSDNIPNALGFHMDNGIRIVDQAADPETCSLLVNDFVGTVPAITVDAPLGGGVGSAGTDLEISFDADLVVTNDNDPDNNLFCLLYDVVVLDDGSNSNGNNKTNTVELLTTANGDTSTHTQTGISSIPVFGEKDNRARVSIVEPILTVTKEVFLPGTTTVPTNIDAGDTLEYRIKVDHSGSSTADAFDLEITDDLTGLDITLDTVFDADGIDNDGDGVIDEADETVAAFWNGGSETFTWNNTTTGTAEFDQLALVDDFEWRFSFTVDAAVSANDLIQNQADYTYTSLPGTPVSPIPERTYSGNDIASFNIDDMGISKSVSSTDLAHTTGSNLAIGEEVTFTVTMTVPEGTINNLDLVDTFPDFIRVDSINVTNDGGGTPGARTEAITDENNADGIDDTATVNYASYFFPLTGSQSTTSILFDVTGTVIDNVANTNNDVLTNIGSIDFTGRNGASPTGTADVTLVEPDLSVVKGVDDSGAVQAGDERIFTLTVDHTGASTADAFDLELTDVLPAEYTLTDIDADGLDNDGDGDIDGADLNGEGSYVLGTKTITWNNANTGLADFTQLDTLADQVFTYKVTVDVSAVAGTDLVNNTSLDYTSAPGVVADERSYNTTDDLTLAVENVTTISKSVLSTNITQTGSSQFTGAYEDVTIGEEITYRISVQVPQGTIPDLIITDITPTAIEPQSASLIQDDGLTYTALTTTITDTIGSDGINDKVTFDFGDITNTPDGDSETIIVEVVALVLDNASNIPANNPFTNTAAVSVNATEEDTDTANIDVVAPSLTVDKAVSSLTGNAGDSFTYTVAITNNGTGPAFDVEATDVIPAGATVNTSFISDGLDNDGDGSTDEADEGTGTFYSDPNFTFNSTTTSNTDFDVMAAGDVITLEYEITLDPTVIDNQVLTNNLDVDYDTYPGTSPDGEEQSFIGSDDEDITAQLNGAVTKTITSGGTDKVIGDTIPYRITITVPEGTTTDLVATDTLPAGLAYVPNSAAITNNNNPQLAIGTTPTDPVEAPASTAIVATESQVLTFDFNTVTNSNTSDGVAEEIYIDFNAIVMNTSDNAATDTHINAVSVDFDGNVIGSNAPAITIVEPSLSTTKTTAYASGNTVTYTFNTIHDAVAEPSAFEVVLTDTFPGGVTYNGNITVTNGPTPTVNTSSFPIVTFTYSEVDTTYVAANPAQFTIDMVVPTSVSTGTALTNNLAATWTSLSGTPADGITGNTLSNERTGVPADPGGAENDYNDTDSVLITVTTPDLSTSSKAVVDLNGGDVQGNDILEYTLTIINTGNLAGTAIQITDNIPDDVNTFTVTSTPAGTTDNSLVGGGTNSTGYLDIINLSLDASGGPNDTKTIVYQVTVDADIISGTTITNDMTVEPATEGGPGATDTATVNTLEPDVAITKSVFPTLLSTGQTSTFTVVVTNNGDSPSLNATIVDIIPTGLTYVTESMTLDTIVQTDVSDGDNSDYDDTNIGGITIVIPSLAAAASATITYQVIAEQTTTNTATVTDDHGENETAQSTVTVKAGSGSGGGGGGTPPTPPDKRDKNNTLEKIAPITGPLFHDLEWEPIEECLLYNPDRPLRFSDIPTDPSVDANILKSTLLFDAIEQEQYVMSGYASKLKDTGEAVVGLDRKLTRLEWAKVLMVSHCLPVYDYKLLPDVTAFGNPMPDYKDLPLDVENPEDIVDWQMDIAYSASYYEIINGTIENNAQMLRFIYGSEAIKMFIRTGEFVHRGEFERATANISPTITEEEWSYEFFAKADFEGTLKDYINSLDASRSKLIRVNAVNMLLEALLTRNLYHPDDEQTIRLLNDL